MAPPADGAATADPETAAELSRLRRRVDCLEGELARTQTENESLRKEHEVTILFMAERAARAENLNKQQKAEHKEEREKLTRFNNAALMALPVKRGANLKRTKLWRQHPSLRPWLELVVALGDVEAEGRRELDALQAPRAARDRPVDLDKAAEAFFKAQAASGGSRRSTSVPPRDAPRLEPGAYHTSPSAADKARAAEARETTVDRPGELGLGPDAEADGLSPLGRGRDRYRGDRHEDARPASHDGYGGFPRRGAAEDGGLGRVRGGWDPYDDRAPLRDFDATPRRRDDRRRDAHARRARRGRDGHLAVRDERRAYDELGPLLPGEHPYGGRPSGDSSSYGGVDDEDSPPPSTAIVLSSDNDDASRPSLTSDDDDASRDGLTSNENDASRDGLSSDENDASRDGLSSDDVSLFGVPAARGGRRSFSQPPPTPKQRGRDAATAAEGEAEDLPPRRACEPPRAWAAETNVVARQLGEALAEGLITDEEFDKKMALEAQLCGQDAATAAKGGSQDVVSPLRVSEPERRLAFSRRPELERLYKNGDLTKAEFESAVRAEGRSDDRGAGVLRGRSAAVGASRRRSSSAGMKTHTLTSTAFLTTAQMLRELTDRGGRALAFSKRNMLLSDSTIAKKLGELRTKQDRADIPKEAVAFRSEIDAMLAKHADGAYLSTEKRGAVLEPARPVAPSDMTPQAATIVRLVGDFDSHIFRTKKLKSDALITWGRMTVELGHAVLRHLADSCEALRIEKRVDVLRWRDAEAVWNDSKMPWNLFPKSYDKCLVAALTVYGCETFGRATSTIAIVKSMTEWSKHALKMRLKKHAEKRLKGTGVTAVQRLKEKVLLLAVPNVRNDVRLDDVNCALFDALRDAMGK